MRITMLDGSPSRGSLSAYLATVADDLRARGHDVKLLSLAQMRISYCTGCWSCWWKTPGECIARDDSAEVCAAAVNADVLLLASPVVMGFYSAVLKKTQDKLIPLIHPYTRIHGGEMRHRKRYAHYPSLAYLFECAADTDAEDLEILGAVAHRFSLNMDTRLEFVRTTAAPAKEIAHAIDRVQWLAPRSVG